MMRFEISKNVLAFSKRGKADSKVDRDSKFNFFINVAGKVGSRRRDFKS
jgi:hypothetical protein